MHKTKSKRYELWTEECVLLSADELNKIVAYAKAHMSEHEYMYVFDTKEKKIVDDVI